MAIKINPQSLAMVNAITRDQYMEIMRTIHDGNHGDPIRYMLKNDIISRENIFHAFAYEKGLPYLTQDDISPSEEVVASVPHSEAREHKILPVALRNGRLMVAVSEPTRQVKNVLERIITHEIDYAIASNETINAKVAEYYSAAAEAGQLTITTTATVDAPSLESLLAAGETGGDSANISKSVQLLIMEGISRNASDIHLEPIAKLMRVRYRVDGRLDVAHELSYTPEIGELVIARIKVLAKLDTTERRKPQDGRISFSSKGKKIDLRIATLPVKSGKGGEKVVMRILANDLAGKPLHELDFSKRNLAMMRAALKKPQGMVLVTGPTGSGKSTTLYSGISEVATDDVNVMTAEDPVEYKFDGVNQVQIHEKIGMTFPAALRSFLRADPDVILVGEIRDGETAEIAIKAALTGHLVLSTLHTNSAALTVSRLVEMGAQPYLVADALTAVVAQRLVKRLCKTCKVPYDVSMEEIQGLTGEIPDEIPQIFEANPDGCRYCSRGYKGRVPIHELLPVTRKVKSAIAKGMPADEVQAIAIAEGGMRTMMQDGWEKIAQGITDIGQVAMLNSEEEIFASVVDDDSSESSE